MYAEDVDEDFDKYYDHRTTLKMLQEKPTNPYESAQKSFKVHLYPSDDRRLGNRPLSRFPDLTLPSRGYSRGGGYSDGLERNNIAQPSSPYHYQHHHHQQQQRPSTVNHSNHARHHRSGMMSLAGSRLSAQNYTNIEDRRSGQASSLNKFDLQDRRFKAPPQQNGQSRPFFAWQKNQCKSVRSFTVGVRDMAAGDKQPNGFLRHVGGLRQNQYITPSPPSTSSEASSGADSKHNQNIQRPSNPYWDSRSLSIYSELSGSIKSEAHDEDIVRRLRPGHYYP